MTTEPTKYKKIRASLEQRERELAFANECLARFSYAISHEIHSPIKTLSQLLQMFEEEHRAKLDEDGRELLDMIVISASRSKAISQGMLDYAECARPIPPDDIKRFSYTEVVESVINELSPEIEECHGEIKVAPLPDIISSPTVVRRVIRHLIINALKFNDAGKATPCVSISAQANKDSIELIVADNGMGIGRGNEERVFDLFTRLNARSKSNGAGLGLSQCQQMATALGGRVWAISKAEGGSAFHFELPLDQAN